MRTVALALLLGLAACSTPFEARVNRFQQLPAPQGQTFAIQAHDRSKAGSLEFATYAGMIRSHLLAAGFGEASSTGAASLVVDLDYAVSQPREKVQSYPGYGGFGYGGYGGGWGGWGGGYGGFGRYGGRFGGFGGYGGFGYGGLWGGGYPEVYSTTLFNSYVAMRISRSADNQSVFEGRAETVSQTNDLTRLVPPLVDALFTGFPGNSGETIRVRLPELPAKAAIKKAPSGYAPG
ncbi:DUF4136 domain-containing protein [Sphingosinicellaceae bacterium]|nr:DUF4136 domain-containing protein [Sphingosinicellaceae bacterium]